MHEPADPTRKPEICHCHISVYALIAATDADRMHMAAAITFLISSFESRKPAIGVAMVVPRKYPVIYVEISALRKPISSQMNT